MRRCTVVLTGVLLAAAGAAWADSPYHPDCQSGSAWSPSAEFYESGESEYSPWQSTSRTGSYGLSPTGWIAVGYDFDNDGSFDTIEYVNSYDLERIRSSARTGGFAQAGELTYMGGRSQRISGEVTDTFRVNCPETGEQHNVAEVQTASGRTIPVDLGPASASAHIPIEPGEWITARGTSMTFGSQPVLCARNVTVQGQRYTLNQPMMGPMTRQARWHRAEVLNVYPQQFAQSNRTHLVALVQLDTGATKLVLLGPLQNLRNLDIQPGERITFRGIPGTVDQQPALIAHQVRAQGQTAWTNVQLRNFNSADSYREAGFGSSEQAWQTRNYTGQVTDVRMKYFTQADRPHVVARVKLDQGGTKLVNLGPVDNLRNCNIEPGEQISFNALRGNIDGQPALIAKHVQAPGQTVATRLQQRTFDSGSAGYREAGAHEFYSPNE
ncbi:MAG: hypothetical protein AB1716_00115 [Planctomycetota bacterium]